MRLDCVRLHLQSRKTCLDLSQSDQIDARFDCWCLDQSGVDINASLVKPLRIELNGHASPMTLQPEPFNL
jgi:hypothetical protein